MSIFKLTFVAAYVGCLMSMIGCQRQSLDRTPEGETRARLLRLADVVIALANDGARLEDFRSIEEALNEVRRRALLTDVEYKYGGFDRDAWGRAYTWSVTKEKSKTICIITSHGKNSPTLGGLLNELSVTIEFPRSGIVQVKRSWEK